MDPLRALVDDDKSLTLSLLQVFQVQEREGLVHALFEQNQRALGLRVVRARLARVRSRRVLEEEVALVREERVSFAQVLQRRLAAAQHVSRLQQVDRLRVRAGLCCACGAARCWSAYVERVHRVEAQLHLLLALGLADFVFLLVCLRLALFVALALLPLLLLRLLLFSLFLSLLLLALLLETPSQLGRELVGASRRVARRILLTGAFSCVFFKRRIVVFSNQRYLLVANRRLYHVV